MLMAGAKGGSLYCATYTIALLNGHFSKLLSQYLDLFPSTTDALSFG